MDNTSRKGRFWKNLGKAIVPAFILNNLSNKQSVGSIDQVTPTNATSFGASLVVVPAAIEVLQKQNKSKTMIGLAAYDGDNQQIALVTDFMTKAARKEWEELHVSYKVEKDGFVEIIASKDESAGLSFVKFGQSKWLQVNKYSSTKAASTTSVNAPLDGVSSGSARIIAPSDSSGQIPPQSSDAGQTCTAWYWCDSFGCSFVGISCQDNIDFGDNPNGGGGGTYETQQDLCTRCKTLAQNEHNQAINFANTTLYTAVLGGCHAAGIGTFISFESAGWWVNLIPGIGTGAIQALSALGALTVDITCLVTAVTSYNSQVATAENNYFKDMNDCNDKYCK